MKNKPNFFLVGWPKSGTTWLYNCFKEHPDVYVTNRDTVHYFSLNYHRGIKWYEKFYQDVKKERLITDLTPNYALDPKCAKRISEFNKDAKILFILRNPIKRAFSHYWHQKKKGRIDYTFEDTLHYSNLGNFDMYQLFIRPGFYSEFLKPYFDIFDKKKLKIILFENLKDNADSFLKEIYAFGEVDNKFKPSILNEKINTATKPSANNNLGLQNKIKKKLGLKKPPALNEYKQGIAPQFYQELWELYLPEIERLENQFELNLNHWKT